MTEQAPVDVPEVPVEATETVPVVPEPAAPKEEAISGKMGKLLHREQQFQAKLRAQKEEIAAERASVAREKAEIEALKGKYARVKEDPIEALKETGLSYEELTRRILNADTPEAKIEALSQKIEAFERSRAEEQQAQQQRAATSNYEASRNQFKANISSNEDKYPTLTLLEPEEVWADAWKVADQYFKQTQEVPDIDDLTQYLEDQASARFKAIDERRSKRVAPPATPAKSPPGKTISNAKVAERATAALPTNMDKMTPDERRQAEADYLAKHLWKD